MRHSLFDSEPIVTGIANELIDYWVRPGLTIASSSIMNDIIDEFETESNMHSGPFALLTIMKKKHKSRHLHKYPIEKTKTPKSTFLKKN